MRAPSLPFASLSGVFSTSIVRRPILRVNVSPPTFTSSG